MSSGEYGEGYVQPSDPKDIVVQCLEQAGNDNAKIIQAMQDGLGINVAQEVRINIDSPTFEEHQAIKHLSKFTTLLMRYGILSPAMVGMWFAEPRRKLNGKNILELLFTDITQDGFDPNNMRIALTEAQAFVRPVEGVHEAVRILYEHN